MATCSSCKAVSYNFLGCTLSNSVSIDTLFTTGADTDQLSAENQHLEERIDAVEEVLMEMRDDLKFLRQQRTIESRYEKAYTEILNFPLTNPLDVSF